uniref:Brf1 TBP-binding domain-containing protein n=1 Tax=Quercus lobata TaxID=97700 RepID=A0A7N2R4V1_QUELO
MGCATENEQLNQRENGSNCNSAATGDRFEVDGVSDKFQKFKDTSSITDDESDSDGLSDIVDVELESCGIWSFRYLGFNGLCQVVLWSFYLAGRASLIDIICGDPSLPHVGYSEEEQDQITADHFSLLAAVTIDVLWKLRSSVLFGGGKWLKFNVDAAWDEDIACVVVVARNSTGEGSKAWVENTRLYSAAAKALAVRWALELVLDMGCKQALMKGLYNVLYLYGFQEQEAVAAAKMDASQIDLENCSDELQAAHELAAAATTAVAKSRKERKRKQDLNAKPAQTAAEAAHQMPIKKRLSSKINYDVLETLFANDPPSDSNKKAKASNGDGSDGEKEHDRDTTDNYEELGQGYEDMEQEDATRIYSNGLHYENEEDFDDYNYDNGDDEYY